MSMFNVFNVAASGLSAQSVRLNTIASNLANANDVAGNPDAVYKARNPVFRSLYYAQKDPASVGVQVERILQSNAPALQHYDPHHPMANEEGYVYRSNVNTIEEMTNMISASRTYQNNVELMNSAKQLLLATLRLGE